MLYKRLIWVIWRHLYTAALVYFKNILHFLTFQTSRLPKTVVKERKNMTWFSCFVRPEKFHPYICVIMSIIVEQKNICAKQYLNKIVCVQCAVQGNALLQLEGFLWQYSKASSCGRPRQACSSHNLDSRIGRWQCCLGKPAECGMGGTSLRLMKYFFLHFSLNLEAEF